jgi:hypothetical protein
LISIFDKDNILSQSVALKNQMELEKSSNFHDKVVNIYRINKEDWEYKRYF